jgi:hypothetical protein
MSPRVLVIDIETAPLESYTWGIWEQNVGLEQIKTEWTILSYAGKFLDSKEVFFNHTGGRGAKKVRDDKPLMGELWNLLNTADVVVAQNGISFDIKKINSRLSIHGFGPYSPVRVVDTLRVARKHFGHTSNKLAWMSKHLTPQTKKSEHKKFPGFELWKECLADNPAAWKEMGKYNKQDVLATEQVYLKQLPWISNHPNVASYSLREDLVCPKCSSTKLQARGFSVTNAGKYQRVQCQDCGGWSKGKTNLLTQDKRKSLLVSQ